MSNEHIEYLFLDFNCPIHHCLKNVDVKDVPLREMDECVINEVLRYSIYIITSRGKPTRLVYIAVDGPVPVARWTDSAPGASKKHRTKLSNKKTKKKYNMNDTGKHSIPTK